MSKRLYFSRAALAVAGTLVIAACSSDTPTSPASRPAAKPVPTFRTAENPDGPGAFVIRFEDIIGFAFVPDDGSITVLTGLTLEQVDVMCSGVFPTFEPASVQVLSSPKLSRVVFKARDFTVLVFEGFFTFCDVPPFAVGEGNYTETGGTTFNGSAISYVQSTFRARVVEPNGEPHHLLIRQHLQFHPKTGEFRVLADEFKFN
jgi:hypothetical protein